VPPWPRQAKSAADIDWLIPHQANIRIMQSTAKKLKSADGKGGCDGRSAWQYVGCFDWLGAGCGVCAVAKSRRGDLLMLEGVGGGLPGVLCY
jgi:3-oxoacyl-[acyl-carrier-protein] synthase-3